MTIDQFKKANKIYNELKERKDFLKAFDSPYSNEVRAHNFDGHVETTRNLLLENDKNLSDFIRGYISDQIAELEKQLEEI